MSIQLLQDNWNVILKDVINPLWEFNFKKTYVSIKLDKFDFISLAGEELTKAFKKYDSTKSNMFTYARTVVTRKAKTAVTHARRDKRMADVLSESIYQQINEDSNKTIEDIIEDVDSLNMEEHIDDEIAKRTILGLLKPQEKRVVEMAMCGLSDKEIACILEVPLKNINATRKKLSESSTIRKTLRMFGYLGG